MKCTNKPKRTFALLMAAALALTGCGNLEYTSPYQVNSGVSSINVLMSESEDRSRPFASELCVLTPEDLTGDGSLDLSTSEAAVLFDLSQKEVLYSKNAFTRMNPASITKIMTALVAIENGSMDQVLTATEAVKIDEVGAQLAGVKVGDTMTLYQALRILLLYSANDVANMIAENIGGSVDGFVDMMNRRAEELGATGTHFVNAHGLTDENHYTTPYDLYLIFNQCIKYEDFNEIISTTSYETTYYDKNGIGVEISVNNSNGYLRERYTAPANVTIIGGKTGTTQAAGHCLIIYSKNGSGNPYISVVLKAESTDALYDDMNDLLQLIVH